MGRIGWSDIKDATFPAGAETPRTVINTADGKGIIYGSAAAANGAVGYAPGSILIDTTNGKVYKNAGTKASADFNEILSVPNYAETAADRGPSPLIWNNCPVLEYMLNPVKGSHYFEDFKGDIYGATNSTTRMCGLTFFNDDGATHQITDDDVHGVLQVEGNDADNDDSAMGYGHDGGVVVPTAGKKFWFEARVMRDSVTDNHMGMFIGLAEEGLVAADTLDVDSADLVAAKDWIGFHVDLANADAIDFVHGDGAGEAVVAGAGICVPVAATYNKLGLYCDGVSVHAYVDGIWVDSVLLSASDMPLDEELGLLWVVKNGDAGPGEHKAAIDWWRLAVEY